MASQPSIHLALFGLEELETQLQRQPPPGVTKGEISRFFFANRDALTESLASLIDKQSAITAQLSGNSALRALYSGIQGRPPQAALELARQLDEAVRRARPDEWVGIRPRAQVIKKALYDILKNEPEVERLFLIVKEQTEYTKAGGDTSDTDLILQRLDEVRQNAQERLNMDLVPYEQMGKLIVRSIEEATKDKRGIIAPTGAGFARFAELAYPDLIHSDWALTAVVREWFRRELPEFAAPKEFDEVLFRKTVDRLLANKRGRKKEEFAELGLQMAQAWRFTRLHLMQAAGLKPPPAQKHLGLEELKALPSQMLLFDSPPSQTAAPTPRSYKVEVQTSGDTSWSSNSQRHPTQESAEAAGRSLFARWTAVKEWRVTPSDDPPNVGS